MNLLRLFTRHAPTRNHARGAPTGDFANSTSLLESLLGMAWVVEARDPYTGGHLWRVSRYAALLCESAGTTRAVCARVSIGAFLHDLGKVGIPDAVLRKPAALSDDELDVIRTHADLGARLLAGHPLAHWAVDAVRSHHERPDGQGYPQGLSGDAVPHAARVVGLCDAFDAMTSTRPYRPAMPVEQALDHISQGLGRQFDEPLGRHFLALGAEGLLDHIAAHSDDGIPLQHCMACGPTLVLRREQGPGDRVYCRNCGGEYRIGGADGDGNEAVVTTGRRGTPQDLAPAADTALIERFVRDTAAAAWAAPVAD
jgi:HD domain